MLRIIIPFITAVLFCHNVQADHIFGGEMSYNCLGNNDFSFKLVIYKDCFGAPFDGMPNNQSPFPATITVFRGAEQDSFATFSLLLSSIDTLSNLSSCSQFCVVKGTYEFEMNIPDDGQTYYFVYQRCCRDEHLVNIQEPLQNGITIAISLTSDARLICNNSPVFDKAPLFCAVPGTPVDFDFSATDPDGNQLVYSFCPPLAGGGTNQSNSTGIDGYAPHPDAPPPFPELAFAGPFTFDNPFNTDPPIMLDTQTGTLSGTVDMSGDYVFAVCVNEYLLVDNAVAPVLMGLQIFEAYARVSPTTNTVESRYEHCIKVYPNPVSDRLFIEANYSETIDEVYIFNAYGQVVYVSKNNSSPVITMETNRWVPGIYYVRAMNNGRFGFEQFVVR